MSKTVIVFSTYYLTPMREYLFGRESVNGPSPFDDASIKAFFWDRLRNDSYYVKNCLVRCVNDPSVFSQSNQYSEDDIKSFLTKNSLDPTQFTIDPNDTLQLFKVLVDQGLLDLAESFLKTFPPNPDKNISVSLNGLSVDALLKQLTEKQPPFDIYQLNIKDTREPWLLYRFSYYALKGNNSDNAVYAVWALNQNTWISVLTNQFKKLNPDLESLYLILHDKDIGLSSFAIVEPKHQISDGGKEFRRTVVVFSHVDEIGKRILGKRGLTTKEVCRSIQEIVENKQKRGYLFSLVRCLASGSDDTEIDEFLEKIKGIDEDYHSKVKSITDSVKKDNGSKNVAENIYEALYKMNVLIGEFENSNNSQP